MQALDIDSQSLGGNGGFGLGGNSMNNPLLWLITLGFLSKDGGALGGGNGGTAAATGIASNSAKIDCLAQGQSFLNTQLIENGQDTRFQNLNDNINNLAGIERDTQDTIFRQTTLLMQQNAAENAAMQRQLAECCCDLKTGQQATQTAIAMQTNALVTNQNANTQAILDKITQGEIRGLETALADKTSQLNISETVKQISDNCGCCNGSQSGGGTNIDINVLLAALLRGNGNGNGNGLSAS